MAKQHRGAIKLAVTNAGTFLVLLPHFAATYFHMQEDKPPGYDKKQPKANETKKETEGRQTEARSETK